MTANQKQLEAYQGANREAARIIAADSAKYPPGSLMAIWADLVVEASDRRGRPGLYVDPDRPAGFAASSTDGMRRSIAEA